MSEFSAGESKLSYEQWQQSMVPLPPHEVPPDWIGVYDEITCSFSNVQSRTSLLYGGLSQDLLGRRPGTSLAEIEANMRSEWRSSFLGQGESLHEVLDRDNEVVKAMGTTHSALAGFLQRFADAEISGLKARYDSRQTGEDTQDAPSAFIGYDRTPVVLENGSAYLVHVTAWRGYKDSPFNDGAKTDRDYNLINLHTGDAIDYSGLIPHLIGRYGFYEGNVGYRVAPEDIARVAGIIDHSYGDEDPVITLTSGQATEVSLTNVNQIARYQNLLRAGHPRVEAAQVTIDLVESTDLFNFLNDSSSHRLLGSLNTGTIDAMSPSVIKLGRYGRIDTFASSLASFDRAIQQKIVSLVSAIEQDTEDTFGKQSTMQTTFQASIAEKDGVIEAQPMAALMEKIDCTPAEFLEGFYRTAGGRYSEWVTQKIGEPRGTRYSKVELDEDRTRALMQIFGEKVMPFVDAFSEAMQIDKGQPQEEQAIAFLKKYHLIGQARKIADHYLVKGNRPDLGVPDWMQIAEAVDTIKEDVTPETLDDNVRDTLTSRSFSLADVIDARKLYPGGSAETVILQLYNGALARS